MRYFHITLLLLMACKVFASKHTHNVSYCEQQILESNSSKNAGYNNKVATLNNINHLYCPAAYKTGAHFKVYSMDKIVSFCNSIYHASDELLKKKDKNNYLINQIIKSREACISGAISQN